MKKFVCIKSCGGSAAGAFQEGKRYDAFQSVGVMYVFGDDGKMHEFRTSGFGAEHSVPLFTAHFEPVTRKKPEPSLETLKKRLARAEERAMELNRKDLDRGLVGGMGWGYGMRHAKLPSNTAWDKEQEKIQKLRTEIAKREGRDDT